MILEALTRPDVRRPILEALREHAVDEQNGNAGEDRLVLSGASWASYLEVDQALGHDRPDPRLYYLDGELEIVTTSLFHEKLKKWLAGFVEDYLLSSGAIAFPLGQATMRVLKEAGSEPDESWCFGEEKEHPDLVLEIALTSGGIDKLEIYRRFSVREVWIWGKGTLEVWALKRNRGGYDGPRKKSRLLPGLNFASLLNCLAMDSWPKARLAFRKTLK